jgi:hypothetical protein
LQHQAALGWVTVRDIKITSNMMTEGFFGRYDGNMGAKIGSCTTITLKNNRFESAFAR